MTMIDSLIARIETLLFIAQKPLSIKKIAELTESSPDDASVALQSFAESLVADGRGIRLLLHNQSVELVSNPENVDLVRAYTREEVTGDLTRAGLETLTVIAYRGPVSKHELEQIRGVNCTIVLRNLMMRGFIDTTAEEKGERRYSVSFDFLRHLGVTAVSELPDYLTLHNDEKLAELIGVQESV